MLKGQRMLMLVASLTSVIVITFIGRKQLPMDWMKKTFRVRRSKVYEALMWLRRNNPIYADINVDRHRLDDLPEDDVPEELILVMREGDDEELLEKERESYLNVDTDGDHVGEIGHDSESEIEGE